MSDIVDAPKKKKGGAMKMLVMLVAALVLCGAGAAGGLYAAGAFTHKEAEGPKVDPNRPVLVAAGQDPEAVAAEHGGGEGEKKEGASAEHFPLPKGGVELPRPRDPSRFHATYFQIQTPFTSNLIDTDSFMQMSIAVSTYYDMRVIEAIKTHEMALRSAILLSLAQEAETSLSTPQGKAILQKKLTSIVNQTLREKTGYSGVDNVYFTNFVIQ